MEDAQKYGHSICDKNGKEDYIELEVIDSSNSTISLFHFKKISSPPSHEEARSSEFEFQMLPNFVDRNTTADELFYNGKLLPLDHIPLHNNPIAIKFLHVGQKIVDFEQSFSTPLFHSCSVSRKLNQEEYSTDDESSKLFHVSKSFGDFDQFLSSPFSQSCHNSRKLNQEEYYYSTDDDQTTSKKLHVTQSFDDLQQSFSTPFFQSCHVSGELNNQEDYFLGYSTDCESSRKSKWPLTKKLRLIKQLSFDHSKIKCLINNSVKLVAKKDLFGKIHHKKSSFSGAIKKLLSTKSCSSKTSTHGNIQEMHLLVRNKDPVYTEVDPIQAAIAHCKKSHQLQQKKFNPRKSNVSDSIGLGRTLSASRIIFEEQDRTGLCRG